MVLKHPLCHGGSKYVLSFEIGQWEGGFYSGRTNKHIVKSSRDAKNFFVSLLILTQMVLKHLLCHEGSKYVLSFKIEQWEVGEKVEHTHKKSSDRRKDRHREIII